MIKLLTDEAHFFTYGYGLKTVVRIKALKKPSKDLKKNSIQRKSLLLASMSKGGKRPSH